jgi:hypothetical protein
MASQRTSVKVTRIIDVTAEEIELILLRHFTNGIGAVNFELSSGPFLRGATIIATTEESNKTVEIS